MGKINELNYDDICCLKIKCSPLIDKTNGGKFERKCRDIKLKLNLKKQE